MSPTWNVTAPEGIHAPAPVEVGREERPLEFSFEIRLRGTTSFRLLPLGERTTARIASSWASPSFDGAFLPAERKVTGRGSLARWDVSNFGRSYPQTWRDGETPIDELRSGLSRSAFGVSLVTPGNQYQQTERSVKYGLLFIVLTFAVVFLLELMGRLRLHPIQYLLVGFALCIFYLLLLSSSEQLDFRISYLAATAATVLLVTLYAASILRSRRRAWVLGSCLSGLYGYLFILLQAEQYALLMGSIGLFLILGTIMFLTRHLDWRTLEMSKKIERAG